MFTSPQPPATITPESLLRWAQEGFREVEAVLGRLGKRQPYQPTWNGSIGNGALRGAFTEFGSSVLVSVDLLAGTTTTFGGGAAWVFSLPRRPVNNTPKWVGTVYMRDQSASLHYPGVALPDDTLAQFTVVAQAADSVRSTIPFTWATGDRMIATLLYPLA